MLFPAILFALSISGLYYIQRRQIENLEEWCVNLTTANSSLQMRVHTLENK